MSFSTEAEAAAGRSRSRKRQRSAGQPDSAASAPASLASELDPPSAPSPPDPIRGKPLDASSLAYFRSLHSSLQSARDTGQDVQLLVAAAYGELGGLEYRLLVNKHGSRCIESLLQHSTPSQLAALLSATRTAAFPLLTDRNASHPLQLLIERLPPLLLDEQRAGKQQQPDSLSSALLAFCQSLDQPPSSSQSADSGEAAVPLPSALSNTPSSCWPLLLLQEQGSFAVRSLTRLMSGATDTTRQPDGSGSGGSGSRRQQRGGVGTATAGSATAIRDVSHVSFLRPVLSALVDSVVGLKEADRIELAFHATAVPALSELLVALSAHPHYHSLLESLLLSLLLSRAAEQPAGSALAEDGAQAGVSVSSRGVAHVAQLCRHRAGSHLVEHMLRAARQLPTNSAAASSTRLSFASLVSDALRSDVAELAAHSTGNHVLQTALALASSSERLFVKEACATLGGSCQQLIGQPHSLAYSPSPLPSCAHICHRASAVHADPLP